MPKNTEKRKSTHRYKNEPSKVSAGAAEELSKEAIEKLTDRRRKQSSFQSDVKSRETLKSLLYEDLIK